MRRASDLHRGARRVCLVTLLAVLGLLVVHAPAARAGVWIQVTCRTSDTPTMGWTGFTVGPASQVFVHPDACPLQAEVNSLANVGDSAVLQYTPPPGSTIIVGTIDLSDSVFPPDSPTYPGVAEVQASIGPAWVAGQDPPGTFVEDNSSNLTHGGSVEFLNPSGGKDLFIAAQCLGSSGECGPLQPTTIAAQLTYAEFSLHTTVQPTASAFSGGLLRPNPNGTVGLLFRASEPVGPGIYRVTVLIDGKTVYRATPDKNDGECVPVGSVFVGVLTFDYPQPCPLSENVDVSVPTGRFQKGVHRLRVIVTDAALTSATVLDTPITLSSTTTPAPRRGLHAQFVFAWTLVGASTLIRRVTPKRLLPRARVAVRCVGHGCPRQPVDEVPVPAVFVGRLLHRLQGLVLPAGTRLVFTVTAAGRRTERVELVIRRKHSPTGKLLSRR